MQKIIIKNFGPVKDAEIEIKKVLVLIGEQASGKSTIAKLIYFFKSLHQYWLEYFSQTDKWTDFRNESNIISFTRDKFYGLFSPIFLQVPNFEVTYFYSIEEKKYLELIFDKKLFLNIRFSENFIDDAMLTKIREERKSWLQFLEDRTIKNKTELLPIFNKYNDDYLSLSLYLDTKFENEQFEQVFIVAGRGVSVNYSDLFEKELFASLKNKINQSIDEFLMLKFIERVSSLKDNFRKISGFEGGIDDKRISDDKKKFLRKIVDIIYSILKGRYIIDNLGEAIISGDKVKIYLNDSSSGQQESIRILQQVFMICSRKGLTALHIIEEPEAHLFPVAQKQLIELLALMVNYQPENQLIITTHSPYILSVFSNLLFASRVVEKNPASEAEVQEIIDKDCWLNPQEFSAYSLGNHSFPEEMQYCEPIFDNKMGNIKQNYLDTVSEILGAEFSQLYSIHGKTFKRR
jgi:energy-coupling factor transporter ATP-binding protein EcfA2